MGPRVALLAVVLALSPIAATGTDDRVSFLEPLEVRGEVAGDVLAIAGDVLVGQDAVVHGHAVSVFGRVRLEPGARVEGRPIALSSLASLDVEAGDWRLQAGLWLLAAGGWLLGTSLLALIAPARVREGSRLVPLLGPRLLVPGLLAALTLMAALVAALSLGPVVGVPLAATLVVAFTLAKALGFAVLGAGLGSWLLGRWWRRPLPLSCRTFVGVAVLLPLRFLPFVGVTLWSALSVLAVGAAAFAVALTPGSALAPVATDPIRSSVR